MGNRQGVYVSATGYTRGASERAMAEGIRPLILTGLTADGLAHQVEEALQSVVHLLLVVKGVTISTESYSIEQPHELLFYYDRDGNVCGSIYDLMYIAWQRGRPPSTIGPYSYAVKIPADWHLVVGGQTTAPPATAVQVEVLGLVVSIQGTAHTHQLVHALSKDVERTHLGASFALASERWPVALVHTEAELARALQKDLAVHVTISRHRLPRILYNGRCWPISARAIAGVAEGDEAVARGGLNGAVPLLVAEDDGMRIARDRVTAGAAHAARSRTAPARMVAQRREPLHNRVFPSIHLLPRPEGLERPAHHVCRVSPAWPVCSRPR